MADIVSTNVIIRPDFSIFNNPMDYIKTRNDILFRNYREFCLSVEIIKKIGLNLLVNVDAISNDFQEDKRKVVDFKSMANRNLSDIIERSYNPEDRNFLREYCRTTFIDERSGTVGKIQKCFISSDATDTISNYRSAVLPITADERELLFIAEKMFELEYRHPITVLKYVADHILPVTCVISESTRDKYNAIGAQ